MRSAVRLGVRPAAALLLALAVAACAGTPAASARASAVGAGQTPAASAATRTPSPSASSAVRPSSSAAAPDATPVGITQTRWGRILDAVPAGFPVFPDATVADALPDGAVSGVWVSKAPTAEVAGWYHNALRAANFAKVDLGSALEDGSRVLDVQGDLPECKAQVTVKPQGDVTMISVLVGAGCAGASG